MSNRLRQQFGAHLQSLRRERGLTQEQFAELIGVSVDFLSLIERGINAPSFEKLEQISGRLKLPVWQLFKFPGATRLNDGAVER
ncbi:MAG: helix-turn-helix transcriptional regulator [Acidobacteria bacterium]|nr:helix-turn-helix transcriptional regulator [Acidobacteriota bacterium]